MMAVGGESRDIICAGDTVWHRHTGEEWFVLGVNVDKDQLAPAGWPHTLARLSDCVLVRPGQGINAREIESRSKMFPGMKFDD